MTRTYAISLYAPPDSARSAPLRHELTLGDLLDSLTSEPTPVARKGDAPAWSPIVYRGARRVAADALAACALVYDLDGPCSPEGLQALEAEIARRSVAAAIHETYTPGRYRLTLPLAADLAPADYSRIWRAVAGALGLESLGLDLATGDLARLFYAPSCEVGQESEAYAARFDGAPLDPSEFGPLRDHTSNPSKRLESSDSARLGESSNPKEIANTSDSVARESPPENACHKIFDLENLRAYLKKSNNPNARELLLAIDGKHAPEEGKRSNTFTSWTGILAFTPLSLGVNADVAVSLLSPAIAAACEPEGFEHWEAQVRRMYAGAEVKAARHRAQAEAVGRALLGGKPSEGGDSWRGRLQFRLDKDGNPVELKPLEANILEVLRNDENFAGLIRFNVLRRRIEVLGGALASAPSESLDVALAVWFQQSQYRANLDRTKAAAVLLHAALENPFDPVQEYLTGLPKWDGVKRIDTVLTRLAEAQGSDSFIHSITRKFFIAAVARAMRPGCQVDTVLVLQGAQGGGKTSFVRALGAGFHVETKLDLHNKDAVMVATGNWLVELSELASLKRGDIESVRAFITTKEDQIRLPYGRTVESFPRRCVYIGTTNALQPLSDQEGNRRFWVVAVGKVDVDKISAERDMLWAEAMAAYKSGERWWLTQDEQAGADEEAKAYTVEDSVELALCTWLSETQKLPAFVTPTFVCNRVLQKQVALITNHDLQAASRAMHRLGWERVRRRIGGRPTWCYVVPKNEAVDSD